MANVGTSLKNWSTTEASNQPDGTDSATIAGDLRAIQAGVRHLRSNDTIASASTCDLGSKDAEYLSISGTTTITALGTVSAGIVKRVVFEGALTLTHGAALLLPGAANITTAAGDAAEFVSLGGGNWRCTQYQKYSGSAVVAPAAEFPSGTRMSFQQTSAPTGWTKDTTAAINDAILRLVTGTASSGGSTAFSTWSSQAISVNATTLSTAEIPAHNHVTSSGSTIAGGAVGWYPTINGGGTISRTSDNTGGGGSHTHGVTGGSAPSIKYYDFIIASKD